MKKIVFLILFLTGLFPVFDNDGLYLESGKVYGQEDPYGNEVVICSEPDRVTTYEYLSYYEVETCVFDNEGGVATNDCEWVCDSQYYDYPPDPDDDPDGDPDGNPDGDGSGTGTGSGSGSGSGGRRFNRYWRWFRRRFRRKCNQINFILPCWDSNDFVTFYVY